MSEGYGMRVELPLPYPEAVDAVTRGLKEHGFGVLTTIDVQQVMREKLGAEFRRYIILGACNPNLSHSAFTTELEIGLLLPCNVIVYEAGEGSVVSVLDPEKMMAVSGNPALTPVAQEARSRLETALAQISAAAHPGGASAVLDG